MLMFHANKNCPVVIKYYDLIGDIANLYPHIVKDGGLRAFEDWEKDHIEKCVFCNMLDVVDRRNNDCS